MACDEATARRRWGSRRVGLLGHPWPMSQAGWWSPEVAGAGLSPPGHASVEDRPRDLVAPPSLW